MLNIAYPLAPVGPDTAGGAEQVLGMLDEGLTRAGHRSLVVAAEGSSTRGALFATRRSEGAIDEQARSAARQRHRRAVAQALGAERVDIVHMHGFDFEHYLPPPGVPTLVTLHLPLSWYSPAALRPTRPRTYLHAVSAAQHATRPADVALLPPIPNGVPVERFTPPARKRGFAVAMGRICPEKGFHLALDAAAAARVPLLLAGEVYPYQEHQQYFAEEIQPRLDGRQRRFIGLAGFPRKRRLLAAARCLLVPSLAPETSSLVAMEALACGTPVIAFPSGALVEIVEHGETGFLVGTVGEMAEAIKEVSRLDGLRCRQAARTRFSAARMVRQYLERYHALRAQ